MSAAHLNAAIRRLGIAHRARTADLLARHGVRIGQELLLLEIDARGESTQAALAQAAGAEPSTITVALRKLESAGLVERTRSVSDARAHAVRLTDAGAALVPQIKAIHESIAADVIAALGDVKPASFTDAALRVTASLQSPPPPREASASPRSAADEL